MPFYKKYYKRNAYKRSRYRSRFSRRSKGGRGKGYKARYKRRASRLSRGVRSLKRYGQAFQKFRPGYYKSIGNQWYFKNKAQRPKGMMYN